MESKTRKPSDYRLTGDFMGSGFGHSQSETIARNIMVMLKFTVDEFKPFTIKDYKKYCTHRVTSPEIDIIEAFGGEEGAKVSFSDGSRDVVHGRYLDRDGDTFSVNDRFLDCIRKWKIPEK